MKPGRGLIGALSLALLVAVPTAARAQAAAGAKPSRPMIHRDTSLVGIDTTGGKVEYRDRKSVV